ncbi:hypothetical protein BG006_000738 [Podila minutissima]|uniref:Uncharacterized protein n=1 Tax=Podila minutissima TaxID=64525 RepID=A0A9P5SB06_9FUNG|nr:hypothetical protein BG006_000738 [Podila minutissima]
MVNKGEDAHRKHCSEDGGGLVRGILVAFRQQIALDSPTSDRKPDTEFTVTEPSLANTGYLVVSAPEPEPKPSSSPSPEVKDVTAEEISSPEPEDSTSAGTMDSTLMLMGETKEEEGSTICDISDTRETGEDDDDSETSESDEPAEPLSAESPARAHPIISSTSAATDIYHDAKAAFLTKMGRRKNSFSEGHDADASSIKSNSTHLSSISSTNPKLSKKRSSKLFGKLVPKFLQTSFSPTLSISSTSPRSQTASLSPLSTRSSRSGSMGGHSSSGKADEVSVKSAGSQESLTRRSGLDLEQCSPGVDEPTCPEYLECLRAEMDGGPSILSARRSSCSSNMSRRSSRSNGSKPSGSSITSLDAEMDVAKNGQGRFTFEVEHDEDEEEEGEEDDEYESDKDGQSADSKIDDSCLSAEYASMDPPLSPYIIDENCDDDFFLNSVLRKKSLPSSPALAYANCSSEPVMSCSYPSNTTISTVNSVATAPSLSGWSNISSQASTPSPTSPSANGQVYPFPVTGAITTNGSQPYQYRSNPLPPPINELVDEKRSRLRDAVGEWRRTANQSC